MGRSAAVAGSTFTVVTTIGSGEALPIMVNVPGEATAKSVSEGCMLRCTTR